MQLPVVKVGQGRQLIQIKILTIQGSTSSGSSQSKEADGELSNNSGSHGPDHKHPASTEIETPAVEGKRIPPLKFFVSKMVEANDNLTSSNYQIGALFIFSSLKKGLDWALVEFRDDELFHPNSEIIESEWYP